MKFEDQLVSKDLSIELRDNDYLQEGLHSWYLIKPTSVSKNKRWILGGNHPALHIIEEEIVAPTVAELMERLPDKVKNDYYFRLIKNENSFGCSYTAIIKDKEVYKTDWLYATSQNTLADTLAKMWLYLKKKGLLK